MWEDFSNALTHFRHKKLRTILSLLGIAIGVTVVSIISNIGSSMQASMIRLFNLDTMNTLHIEPRWDVKKQTQSITLNEEYRSTLKKEIPLIKEIFYTGSLQAHLSNKHITQEYQQLKGIERGWLSANAYELLYGTGFQLDDFANHRHKIVIDEEQVKTFFPEGNPIGKNIIIIVPYKNHSNTTVLRFSFEVCGVVKPKNDYYKQDSFYIPRSFLTEEMGSAKNNSNNAVIQVYNSEDVKKVTELVKTFSDRFAKHENSLWTFSQQDLIQQINTQILLVSAVLTIIAAMSLLVGGINIMNIMLVTVTERKKEIGIRKALGANEKVIRNQFLVESATLSLTGGIVGTIFGGTISIFLVEKVFQSEKFHMVFEPNLYGMIIAFVVTITIGIFFGLQPAMKAARLDPVAALAD